MEAKERRLKILSWHIHGSYLYYLSQGNFDIYLPTSEKKTEGYFGRGTTFPFGENVIEVPVRDVQDLAFDCILFQTPANYLKGESSTMASLHRIAHTPVIIKRES